MFCSLLKACAARVILVEISFLMLLYGCQDTWSPALLPNPHHVPLFSICSCFLLSSPWSCQNESCVWSSSPGYLSGCVNAETCHLQSCSVLIWLLVPCCLCPVSLLITQSVTTDKRRGDYTSLSDSWLHMKTLALVPFLTYTTLIAVLHVFQDDGYFWWKCVCF